MTFRGPTSWFSMCDLRLNLSPRTAVYFGDVVRKSAQPALDAIQNKSRREEVLKYFLYPCCTAEYSSTPDGCVVRPVIPSIPNPQPKTLNPKP